MTLLPACLKPWRALALVASLASVPLAAHAAAALHVDGGLIAKAAPDANGVRAYKGLPYAAAPLGPLRWRPPAPVRPWTGVRPVDRFGPECMQERTPRSDATPMSEDCLFLNVWTPARPAGAKGRRLPVFVWIHGGGSRFGSGSQPIYDGAALARKGMVVVTINYRLDVLGWLALPALSAESGYHGSGDYGLMDDVAALHWVQRNIAAFGGDPKRVTVGGESAGSVATSVLMASPLAKGLFAQAIGESASAFRRAEPGSMGAASLASEEAKGQALAKIVADHTGRGDLDALRAVPAKQLLADARAAEKTFTQTYFNIPVVDGRVLPDTPAHIFAAHRQNDVPLLTGWNAQEGSVSRFGVFAKPVAAALDERFGPAAVELQRFYPHADAGEALASQIRLAGDEGIAYGGWLWAEAQLKTGKSPVYLYVFGKAPPIPEGYVSFPRNEAGAFHGAEMVYVFDNLDRQPGWAFDATDRRVAAQMSRYWAAFIKTGRPDPAGLPAWPAYDAKAPVKLRIDAVTLAEPDRDVERMHALEHVHAEVDTPNPLQPDQDLTRFNSLAGKSPG